MSYQHHLPRRIGGPPRNDRSVRQRRTRARTYGAVAAFGLLTVLATGCATEIGNEKSAATTGSAAPAAAPENPARTTNAAETEAHMPNVVCMNLQAAQNKIQEAGVFYSRSSDATGKGRKQVVDRNWIVVSQTPTPGTPFGEGDAVLSVVKLEEPNSCG